MNRNPEAARAELPAVLEEARSLGFLGPGPVDDHIRRSGAFTAAWDLARPGPPESVLDLGSGGGVPGLVLALAWPEAELVLLDGNHRRTAFLSDVVARLGLGHHARTVCARAEEAARGPLRESAELVVARGFGPPAVTAECAVGLLAPDGLLAVSEPPGGDETRWPKAELTQLGLEAVGTILDPATVQVLRRQGELDPRYPRRVGIPAKRPLWRSA